MSGTLELEVVADHAVPVTPPAGGTITILNQSGDSLFYADSAQVSSGSNQGSLTATNSATFSLPQWIRSASLTTVQVTFIDPAAPSSGSGVSQIVAGTNVTVSPSGGTGAVTVNASGGGSGVEYTTTDGVLFVSKAGNDTTGDGTRGNAFLTVGKAVATALAAGGSWTIKIFKGVYTEEVWVVNQFVNLIAEAGVPGAAFTASVVIRAPSDTVNALNIIGANCAGMLIDGITTEAFSSTSTGWGIRGAGASYVTINRWQHNNQGRIPNKIQGGGGLLFGHGEGWTVNGLRVSSASKSVAIGVESTGHTFVTPRPASNYQDWFNGPLEPYRARLSGTVNSSVTTLPVDNSNGLIAGPALAFTKDFLAAPATPTASASGTGNTVPAGTYTFATAYTDPRNGETVISPTQTQVVGSGQQLVINSPAAAPGATGWYAYVSQAGGSTLTRQQAAGAPSAITAPLTIIANPTTTGTTPRTTGTAYTGEGIAYTANTANQLTGAVRAVVAWLGAAITNVQTAGINVRPLSPGNYRQNGIDNPVWLSSIPTSGTLLLDSEQITYTSLTNNGDGTFTLGTVTRHANATTAAAHPMGTPCQDTALTSAASHGAGVEVIQAYAGGGGSSWGTLPGAWGGASTFIGHKGTSVVAQFADDYAEEWYGGDHTFIAWDSDESGNTNRIRFYASSLGNQHFKRTVAQASTITDDSDGVYYRAGGAGSLVLSSTFTGTIENNNGLSITDNSSSSRYSALRLDSNLAAPRLDHLTALVDQNALYFDVASGKVKGKALIPTPAGGSSGQVLTFVDATHTAWAPASGGGAGAPDSLWAPTGAVENISRSAVILADVNPLVSARLQVFGGAVIPANKTSSNITFRSGSQAIVTPTHQWFCLLDTSLNVLAVTADDLTTAWGTFAAKTLALSATYTPSVQTAVYIGICVVAATVPKLRGLTMANAETGVAPVLEGGSTTGLTTPASLTSPATAPSAAGVMAYCYLT